MSRIGVDIDFDIDFTSIFLKIDVKIDVKIGEQSKIENRKHSKLLSAHTKLDVQ